MPALVHIEPVKSFFTTGERRHTVVTGSGFIFSPKGYIMTNYHVVENAERVDCTLFNKKKYSARIIGSDPSTDIAVLQLNMEEWGNQPLPFASLGNSDSLQVGQMVLALGSPLGLSRSVSMGVISSLERYFEYEGRFDSPFNLWIQTDAAINPGNSGGPLINLRGEVVGVNSRTVFLAENLGFAIPINLAKEIAEKLIAGQKIQRSWVGIEIQPVREYRNYLNLNDLKGVLVSSVDPHSPAEKAGIRPGDVIVSINQNAVNAEFEENLPAIRKLLADLPINEKVRITIWRNGKRKEISVKTQSEPFEHLSEFECNAWGMVVKSMTRYIYQMQALPDYQGVYISAVKNGGAAEKAGLRAGDVIRSINHKKIKNMEDFQHFYQKLNSEDKEIFIEVFRQGAIYFAVLSPANSSQLKKTEKD